MFDNGKKSGVPLLLRKITEGAREQDINTRSEQEQVYTYLSLE